MAKKELTAQDQGKTYRVTEAGQQVGPWTTGQVFSEHGFAALHPIPDTPQAKAQVNADTYHDDLIGRLLALGHVAEAPDAEPSPLTDGPHAIGLANQSIKESVAEHERSKATRAAAGQEDVRQRTADNKAGATSATPEPVRNAEVVTPTRVGGTKQEHPHGKK